MAQPSTQACRPLNLLISAYIYLASQQDLPHSLKQLAFCVRTLATSPVRGRVCVCVTGP